MTFRDHPPIGTNAETELQKLKLEESLFDLFDISENESSPDSEQSTHIFTDESFLSGTWLPVEVESLLLHEDTVVKSISVSYDVDRYRPTPMLALTFFLQNGERLVISKDPLNFRTHGFEGIYSDPSSEIPEIANEDVGRLLVSLLFAQADKPDVTVARMLSSPDIKQTMNPTDPAISYYILRLLDSRSDSWQKEQTTSHEFEDDRNMVRLTKTTCSNGTIEKSLHFVQQGSEILPDAQFELTASILQSGDGSLTSTSLDYEKIGPDGISGIDEKGSAVEKPELYDFMLAVIANVKSSIAN